MSFSSSVTLLVTQIFGQKHTPDLFFAPGGSFFKKQKGIGSWSSRTARRSAGESSDWL